MGGGALSTLMLMASDYIAHTITCAYCTLYRKKSGRLLQVLMMIWKLMPVLLKACHHSLVFISAWHAMFKVSINAINCLLKFFKFFIWSMGNSFQLQQLCDVGSAIPSSLKAVHKSLNIKDEFICYVVVGVVNIHSSKRVSLQWYTMMVHFLCTACCHLIYLKLLYTQWHAMFQKFTIHEKYM